MFGGKPARGLPTPPPHPTARRNRTFNTWKMCECNVRTRFLLAGLCRGEWGRAEKNAKRCHSLTGQRINWKVKTKIANNILLLCYLYLLLVAFGKLRRSYIVNRAYKREPELAASPQSTTLHSTVNTSVIEGSRPQQHTWNSKPLFFSR